MIKQWPWYALGSLGLLTVVLLLVALLRRKKRSKIKNRKHKKNYFTYDDIYNYGRSDDEKARLKKGVCLILVFCIFLMFILIL